MKGRVLIAAGFAILAFVARPLPAFVLPAAWADWWFWLVVGDPSNGMAFAHAAYWLFIQVPIFTPVGIGLVAWGMKELRK